ncbi:leucine-rich repeat domain-containing protein [Pseudomonas koreensis]|uniref:leucine-rich repeat domain-containing protein n=1 Tax=Pseudomonas koreensis TaxID=198620 RepID=UPI002FC80E35
MGALLDPLLRPAPSSIGADIEAVSPSHTVVVHAAPLDARPIAPDVSLAAYVTDGRAIRAPVNNEGLRVINQRTYADLQIGGMAMVAADPHTGLYRARRPSELLPSGPVLLRDAASGLWHPRLVVEQATRAQVKKYLPEATDQQADDFVALIGDKDISDVELRRVQIGFSELDSTIKRWDVLVDRIHHNYKPFETVQAKLRRLYKWLGEPDERVYRNGRMTGFKLQLELNSYLVRELATGQFNSISDLTIILRWGWDDLDTFLAQFPNVESLKLASHNGPTSVGSGFRGKYFPDVVTSRTAAQFKNFARLRELDLQECSLLSDFSVMGMNELRVLKLGSSYKDRDLSALVGQLSDLRRLQVLELQRNVLRAAPDVSDMAELRYLDLTDTGIFKPPAGLDSEGGPKHLEVLKLADNPLHFAPSVKTLTALRELDLSNTGLEKFPEGITPQLPTTVLNLSNNRIKSIPESVELRAGFNLNGNPINDPSSLRRLIHARIKTGSDIWLAEQHTDRSAALWLRNVPQAQAAENARLWDSFEGPWSTLLNGIRTLSRTSEFHVERPLLQRRVWRVLENFSQADAVERAWLSTIVEFESSPGKMLDWLEAEIRKYDGGRQNPPLHHRPKRPRLE